jgi:hypothetical protein
MVIIDYSSIMCHYIDVILYVYDLFVEDTQQYYLQRTMLCGMTLPSKVWSWQWSTLFSGGQEVQDVSANGLRAAGCKHMTELPGNHFLP